MPRVYYLIDGYNLVHALGMLPPRGASSYVLERARLQLLDALADAPGVEAATITVIFDASRAPPGVVPEQQHRGVRVLFALNGLEADDVIEDLLAHHPSPKQTVVISDDHRLQRAARRRKGTFLACSAFLDLLERPLKQPPPSRPTARDDKLSPEETQRWLDEFGDRF